MKPNFDPVIEECIKEARANLYMVRTSRQQEYMPYCDRLFAYAASEQSDYLRPGLLLYDAVLCLCERLY